MGESSEIFAVFRKYMEQEENLRDELRNVVKDLDQASRDIITILQNVHKPTGLSQISEICEKAREKYTPVKELFSKLRSIVPEDEFYRFNDHWRFVSQRLVFSAAFIVFLEDGKLIDRDTAADLLGTPNVPVTICNKKVLVCADIGANRSIAGECMYELFVKTDVTLNSHTHDVTLADGITMVRDTLSATVPIEIEGRVFETEFIELPDANVSANPEDSFHIELDDFLLGLLLLADELTRLSMNSAAFGDYKRSVQIAEFVSDMNAGFRLLNLKNDNLRKKFDGLKYNLKKVEEVVYDLSIRGLIKTGSDETAAS